MLMCVALFTLMFFCIDDIMYGRDILPGCTEVISLHMTTLQEGTIFMRDLFLVERTNWYDLLTWLLVHVYHVH